MDGLDMLGMLGMMGLSKALEFFDTLPSPGDMLLRQLPFLLFVAAIIIGNLWDKKKPGVQKPKPFPGNAPLPDIKPPADVTVDVRPIPQPPVRQKRDMQNMQGVRDVQDVHCRGDSQENGSSIGTGAGAFHAGRVMDVSLAQAVIAAEVLGKPRALRPKKR